MNQLDFNFNDFPLHVRQLLVQIGSFASDWLGNFSVKTTYKSIDKPMQENISENINFFIYFFMSYLQFTLLYWSISSKTSQKIICFLMSSWQLITTTMIIFQKAFMTKNFKPYVVLTRGIFLHEPATEWKKILQTFLLSIFNGFRFSLKT